MAQSGYTPISIYYSATATNVPLAANLTSGELGINIADGKLYYKDNAGAVQVLASKAGNINVSSISFGTTGLTPSTTTTGAVTVAGTLVVSNGGTGQTTLATGSLGYGQGTSAHAALAIGTAGQVLTVNSGATAPQWVNASSIIVGAGGSNTQVQYNSSGSLAGSANMTFDGSTLTTLNTAYTGTLTGGTGVVNLGSGQFYKDASGNVIIGGTSPLNSGSGRGSLSVNGTTDSIVAWGIGGAAKSYIYNASDHFEITTQGSYYMSFQTANTERMRIDSSGNVGIGVTPNAQSIGGPALQFYGGLQICGNNSRSYIDANAYWNGSNWIRIAALPACQQVNDQNSGTFTWNSTATGAAGSTIGWTGILSIGKDVTVALQGANLNSGTGISFPATQNASSDANTLDDYEKGTWTPTLTGTTPATGVTYSSQQGTYTKIGNIVYIRCTVQTSNKGTGGGGVACIGGIPFSATGLSGGYAYQSNIIYYYTSTGISGSISGTIYDNGNTIQFSNPFNATNTVASSVLANIERISFNMVYQVS